MKTTIIKSIVTITFLLLGISANAQIKYYSNGKVTMGNTEPYSFYHYTHLLSDILYWRQDQRPWDIHRVYYYWNRSH